MKPNLLAATPSENSPRKEVRLHLPLRFHISLHTLRLIMNRSISTIVMTALDDYFAQYPAESDPTKTSPSLP